MMKPIRPVVRSTQSAVKYAYLVNRKRRVPRHRYNQLHQKHSGIRKLVARFAKKNKKLVKDTIKWQRSIPFSSGSN